MRKIIFLILFLPLFGAEFLWSSEIITPPPMNWEPVPEYRFIKRDHSTAERFKQVAAIYALSAVVYPLTQPDIVRKNGSFSVYKKNFGKIVFDQDEPFWNWFVHPISGSQLYLLYRSFGHSRQSALSYTFLSSALFEFTIEIYTEPASLQDLIQTPLFGTVLGMGLETASFALLNTRSSLAHFFGHLINPATLFSFYRDKNLFLTPLYKKGAHPSGLKVGWEF
jgi:hypothetical protein